MKRLTNDYHLKSPVRISMNFPKRNSLLAAALILMTLLVYIPAMQGGFVWDDDAHVTNNPELRSLEGLKRIWLEPGATPQYYPLAFTTFWVEYRLWELNPAGYHMVNVFLHVLSALLLWRLLLLLDVPGAWLMAAVFALHPVHVESVAWVTERKNVLSGFFYFSSALCLIRFFGFGGERGAQPRQWYWYGLGLVLFVCALLSKTVTCSLPAAMVLILWWKRGRVNWQELSALAPFFLLGLGLGLATAWLERRHVGAMGPEWELSMIERFLVAGRALWFYAGKLVWPAKLTFTYPRWQINPSVWWQYVYPLGVLLVISVLWGLRSRVGRGPLVAVLFFCGTLFPALGFFDVYPFRYSYVADHFQYLASIGLIVLTVGVLAQALSELPMWPKRAVGALALLVLASLAVQTWRQGYIYENIETLWTDTLKKNPGSWQRHHDLATILAWQGRLEEAVSHFSEALRLNPDFADAHTNFANVLSQQGKVEDAKHHYYEALRSNPEHPVAHQNLAGLLVKQGRNEEAISHFTEHLRINPLDADGHYNLGTLLAMQGRLEEAVSHFNVALRINPNHASARRNLDIALQMLDKSAGK
jgi:tetratricopeptide (TPR) repeat protein